MKFEDGNYSKVILKDESDILVLKLPKEGGNERLWSHECNGDRAEVARMICAMATWLATGRLQ